MKKLFLKHIKSFANDDSITENTWIHFNIIEEYILLDFLDKSDYSIILGIIKSKFNKILGNGTDLALYVKLSCFELLTTMIIKVFEEDKSLIGIFEEFVLYSLIEITSTG